MSNISGEKDEGNFLNKDGSKVATLLQQADLLSSLAAKIKTENTSQNMDEAWQVCEQELKCFKVLITCPGNKQTILSMILPATAASFNQKKMTVKCEKVACLEWLHSKTSLMI
jgi:hypothetical protein